MGKTKNAVKGCGLPSYISAAHRWQGKAANLNKNPIIIKYRPIVNVFSDIFKIFNSFK